MAVFAWLGHTGDPHGASGLDSGARGGGVWRGRILEGVGILMHEMSLCEGILQILEDNAASQRYQRVKVVWLEIGALSGVEPEAMRFGFDVVMKGTLADGARLEIIDVPGAAWCMQCAATVAVQQRFDSCPRCGGYQLQISGGEAMRIKELEVE